MPCVWVDVSQLTISLHVISPNSSTVVVLGLYNPPPPPRLKLPAFSPVTAAAPWNKQEVTEQEVDLFWPTGCGHVAEEAAESVRSADSFPEAVPSPLALMTEVFRMAQNGVSARLRKPGGPARMSLVCTRTGYSPVR